MHLQSDHPSNNFEQIRKRLSSPRAHPDEPSPKLTVQDKLREAAEAAAATEEKATSPTRKTDDNAEVSKEDSAKRAPRSPGRTRVGGRPKKRRSTLTADELASLLGC